MALEARFADGGTMYGPVESLTTGEEFAASLLKARGIEDCYGWTVDLDDDGDLYELNGYDYVLDLVAETEVPPAFPVCKSFFLVSANKNKKTRSSTWAASPHNPERINTFEIEIDESPPAPIRYKQPIKSRSIDDITRADQHSSLEYVTRERRKERIRSSSHERLLDDTGRTDPPLSKTSALNDRYFENGKTTRSDLIVDDRSRARPEPIGSMLGLSKSKLNERYTEREVQGLSETSKLNKSAWQDELGLASSALNDRYFSRQELLKQTKTDGSDAGSRRDGSVIHGASPSIDETSKINGHSPDMNGSGNNRDNSNSSQASIDAIEFPEFDFPENGDEQEGIEPDDFFPDPDGSRCSRQTESTRYVKYGGKQMSSKPHSHSTKAHIDRNRDDYSSVGGPKSSAMSDTSEAPSLASHVKNVRIPSHTSDLDQYLDDLFNPVLDGNLDELSDARSLAASIKGGRSPEPLSAFNANTSETDPYNILDELLPEPFEEDLRNLEDPEHLAKALKGGGKAVGGGIDTQQRGASNGLHSQSMTPNLSTPSPALPGGVGNSSASSTTGGNNLPLYNLSGMTVPMVDASQLIQQQLLQQQMIQLQQRAFLASAVQQNLQIQQHLMQQNQALQHLLSNSSVSPASPVPMGPSLLAEAPLSFPGAMSPPTLGPLHPSSPRQVFPRHCSRQRHPTSPTYPSSRPPFSPAAPIPHPHPSRSGPLPHLRGSPTPSLTCRTKSSATF
ncbi:hypothetical protein CEXT_247881 [Caerostris extrusa]|uniref:Uncharacterized protein n=1 Tax=Caerostris extrusa TaxID=172846 RepID=A0AAV4M5C1_CAEEX|nr:hypothetical protein CEXT_247881 [Caerostris extrusa]